MNTGTVAQPPIATGEVATDRSRAPGRQGAPEDEINQFSGLLSRLAGNRDGRQPAPATDKRGSDGDNGQIMDWLRVHVEAAVQDGREADVEPAHEQHDRSGGGLTDIDVSALMQLLSGSGVLASAEALAATVGRLANGTATEAETAMVQAALAAQENGETLSPEQLILASLEKVPARTGEPPSNEMKATSAVLTILHRETHLAPVGGAQTGWAARLATEGNGALRGGAQSLVGEAGDARQLQSAVAVERSEEASLANPQTAVTATRDGQLGAGGRRGASPSLDLQVTADVLPDTSEQAPEVQRADALVNTGPSTPVVQQIAQRVAVEAATFATQTERPNVPMFGVKLESPVKVMHIQLQPENLGVVTIRLSVKDNALRLDLEVGRGETGSLIQRDRDVLSALLRSAGYVIDGMDVRVADPSGPGAQSANGQTNTPMQGGGQSGSSQAEERSPGERSQHERGANAFGNGRKSEDDQAGQSARGGGIYI